jgi:hypothetical protein
MLVLLATSIIAVTGLHALYPFLAITKRVPTRILVLNWVVAAYDNNKAAALYLAGHYQQLLDVNGTYDFQAIDQDPGNAYIVKRILVRDGVPPDQVKPVIFPGAKFDRTYISALAVNEWCRQNGIPVQSLDIVTLGPHARRSRLIYEKALGNGVKVGVIALDDPAYDSRRWWRSSEGVREVLFEFVAYFYVRFFFLAPQTTEVHLLPSSE